MAAIVALGVAVLSLAFSCAGVWAVLAWRRERRRFDALAESLYADSRIELLTVQTLAAMREAIRSGGRQ